MWLAPTLNAASRVIARTFYRLTIVGERVPSRGRVLLVANHTNALLDPAVLLAAARRSVRILAKSTLFEVPVAGTLLRWCGCVPVYRRQDDATRVERNFEMFEAVETGLVAGAAVGVFPEGISHDATTLAPLKTGAARIALGVAARTGGAFPIVPVGLLFADKAIFRSTATALVGPTIAWNDLAMRGPHDAGAVRELTSRIDAALRAVTMNVTSRADLPALECGADVYAAEHGHDPGPAARVERVNVAATLLESLRAGDERGEDWSALMDDLRRHARRLSLTRLTAADLTRAPGAGAVLRWVRRTLPLAATGLVAVAGGILFVIPYRATAALASWGARGRDPDTHGTIKALAGLLCYGAWMLLLAVAAGLRLGWWTAPIALVVSPLPGAAALAAVERWRASRDDARRFLLLRNHRAVVEELRAEQRALAARIDRLLAGR